MKTLRTTISIILYILLFIASASFFFAEETYAAPDGFEIQTIATGLTLPTDFEYAPHGHIFVTEKSGVVRIIEDGVLEPTPFITLTDVNDYGDRGLIGITLDPDYETNGYVYLAYVYENDSSNYEGPKTGRVIRVTAQGHEALPGSEVIIIGTEGGSPTRPSCEDFPSGTDCIPSDSPTHTVDDLEFGPDGMLYVSIGDGTSFDVVSPLAHRAGDIDSLSGKVLRVNPDGTGLADNPHYDGDPTSNRSKVWASGLRNPFRFDFRPSTGVLYLGDVGWFSYEEVNVVFPGADFGWPCREGAEANPGGYPAEGFSCGVQSDYDDPLFTYAHDPDTGAGSVTGGVFYTGSSYPSEYQDTYFYGDFAVDFIKRIVVDGSDNFISDENFEDAAGGPVAFGTDIDGNINYLSIYTGELRKIVYIGGNVSPIAVASANKTSGLAPLEVFFSSSGSSDPDGDPISFLWNFDDTEVSSDPHPTHTFASNGTYNVTLTVTDQSGASDTDTVTVTVGNIAPTAIIASPSDGDLYIPLTNVPLLGIGTDPEDGIIDADAQFSWRIILHHNIHIHVIQELGGRNPSILAPDHGPEPDVFVEIELTVADSSGLTDTTSIFVYKDSSGTPEPVHVSSLVSPVDSLINIPVTITSTIANTGDSEPILVDIELYNSANEQVAQIFYDDETISSTTPRDFTLDYTPTVADTYRVAVGLIETAWGGLYEWTNDALSFVIGSSGDTNQPPTITLLGADPLNVDVISPPSNVVFNLTGVSYAFSQEEIRVQKGDTVTINFESVEGFHDWVVDEFGAATTRVSAGGTTTVTFVADNAGSFEYYCSVGAHRALGMIGTLVVEDTYTDPGATASDPEDGDVSSSIIVGGEVVDTTTVGTYLVTYNVMDSGGLSAPEVTRSVIVSNPGSWTPTPPNGAVYFDGVDDYIDTEFWDIEEPIGFTLEARFAAESFSGDTPFIGKAIGTSSPTIDWMFGLRELSPTEATLVYTITSGGTSVTLTGGSIAIGEFVHASAVYDNTDMIIYKNGVEVARVAKTGLIAQDLTHPVWLGNLPEDATANAYHGIFDEIRVWNEPQSAAEIVQFQGELTQKEFGLIKDWRFNEGFGQVVIDRSNSGHHGHLGSVQGVADSNDPVFLGGIYPPGGTFAPTHSGTVAIPNPVLTNASTTITVTVDNTGDGAGFMIINVEVYDSTETQVFQTFVDGEGFAAGESRSFDFEWIPTAEGSYRVAVGLVHLFWADVYEWVNDAAAIVVDATATNTVPVITLLGTDPLNLNVGDPYTDPGATATDTEDGDLTGSIVVGGAIVDTSVAGTYIVTYDVTDSGGLSAAQIMRDVVVTDPGGTPFSLSVASATALPGAALTGEVVTVSVDVTNAGDAGIGVVNIELYSGGVQVHQVIYEDEAFLLGETRNFSFTYTPTIEETYTISVGLYTQFWAGFFGWFGDVAIFTASDDLSSTGPTMIYDDSLAPGFTNWSWDTTVDLASIAVTPNEGVNTIEVTFDAVWGGLYLHNDAFDTTGETNLIFDVHGGVAGGQVLQVISLDASNSVAAQVLLTDYISSVQSGSFSTVTIPLADLNIVDQISTGIIFQGASEAVEPTFYLDNIRID